MGAPLTRRGFVAVLGAAGGALGAAPASAAPNAPALRPGNSAPVRATYRDTMAYFDFNGAQPARAAKAKAQPRLEDLTPEQRWLLGIL